MPESTEMKACLFPSYKVSVVLHRSALRNWEFQVSKDGTTWTTLRKHKDDCSLNEPGYGTSNLSFSLCEWSSYSIIVCYLF